jgi:hypothetical protein
MTRKLTPYICRRAQGLVAVGLDAHVMVDAPLPASAGTVAGSAAGEAASASSTGGPAAVPTAATAPAPAGGAAAAVPTPDADAALMAWAAARAHYIPDADLNATGFAGLQDRTCGKRLTAWERATLWAHRQGWDFTWLVEDDVQWAHPRDVLRLCETYVGDAADLVAHKIAATQAEHPRWPHWRSGYGLLPEAHWTASFNVISRMSKALLAAAAAFGAKRGMLAFHELFFPTLVRMHGLRATWYDDAAQGLLLRFRPPFEEAAVAGMLAGGRHRIFHPVKHESPALLAADDTKLAAADDIKAAAEAGAQQRLDRDRAAAQLP